MANCTPKHSYRRLPNHLEKIKSESRERRRNVLYLILGYLKENMLENTADTLIKEAQLDGSFQLCENVELDVILQEYQSYYYTKFQKYPKIVRKLEESELKPTGSRGSAYQRSKSAKRVLPSKPTEGTGDPTLDNEDSDFQFEIVPLTATKQISLNPQEEICPQSQEVLVDCSSKTSWSECVGLENVIEVLKESTIYPILYPDLFRDVATWRGVLLYGPPGTGKTLLAKALAYETQTTFFNLTCSAFTSKWRGESEKMIKNLFEAAKLQAPSTIFLDEVDALLPSNNEIQHEASKRFRSELLTQLDGVIPNDHQVLVLASTNSPWELDGAVLRRFDKRILIEMPSKEARQLILKQQLNKLATKLSLDDLDEFGRLTDNYSGSDIKNIAKEVTMVVIRERIRGLEKGGKGLSTRPITLDDLKKALQKIRPSTNKSTCKKYNQWQNEHGAC